MSELFEGLAGPALVVFRGLPASGKTERAKQEVLARPPGEVVRVNRDDLRRSLCIRPNYEQPQEDRVSVAQYAMITALLRDGAVVISDDTNLNGAHVATLRAIAALHDASFHVVDDFLAVSPEECIERDRHRGPGEFVGETVIMSKWWRYLADGGRAA